MGDSNKQDDDPPAGRSGRVVHDERGNAIWDWIKDTGRAALESTSHLLKRLELPELQVEDTAKSDELSLESDRDPGGGYNPYGEPTSSKGANPRGGSATPVRTSTPGAAHSRSGNTSSGSLSVAGSTGKSPTSNPGGGYDPYGKSVTRKPTR